MKLTLLFFAGLRDLTGKSTEDVDLAPAPSNVKELRGVLLERFPRLVFEGVRVAKNEEFVSDEDTLREGDVVAFIPPVSGG